MATSSCRINVAAFVALAILFGSIIKSFSATPPFDYSDKQIGELVGLLNDTNVEKRECAAYFLGVRYMNPHRPDLLNKPLLTAGSPKPEFPIPTEVIPQLTTLLTQDSNVGVRLSALGALENLRYQTNTSPIIIAALTNSFTLVRMHAAESLNRISKQYNEQLPSQVVPTLISCLNPAEDPDEIWQAALIVGNMGASAKAAIPALEKLKTHPTKKVRQYAEEALERINAPPQKP